MILWLFLIIYTVVILALCWCDLRYGLLPDRLTCPLLWSGLLFHLCLRPEQLAQAILGAISGYAGFALIYWSYRWLRKQEGMGYGDVKFLAALGAWHGWQLLPQLVCSATALVLIFLCIRAVIGVSLRALKNPLPFGPFLATAGFLNGWRDLLSFQL